MKTPISEPIFYKGWVIELYLENHGFSYRVTPPSFTPVAPIEDGWIYSTLSQARCAAKKLVKVETAALALELWLVEMYTINKLSIAEYESMYVSIREAYKIQGSKQ